MIADFVHWCPNVASLIVREKSGIWTGVFGEQIELLEIWNHCSRLRELTVVVQAIGWMSTPNKYIASLTT